MNGKTEAEMTKMDLTPENLAESEDEVADEAIPIHISKKKIQNHTKIK